MPIGVLINAGAVFFGGIVGALLRNYLSEEFKEKITLVLGLCSMGMGIYSIALMKNMPVVILSVVLGTGIGIVIHLGYFVNFGAMQMQRPIAKIFKNQKKHVYDEESLGTLVTILVLFCASGTGIYGALDAGMTGDHTILLSKSILDFFTAAIFACILGIVVSVVAIPQVLIFLILFFTAKAIYPLTTADMIADFKACGGILILATGFRMIKLKDFPIAEMIPAMVLVMPLSYLWTHVVVPLL